MISAEVRYVPSTKRFYVELTDVTTGASFNTLSPPGFSAQQTSAEWIVEAPSTVTGVLEPLADFDKVFFGNNRATVGKQTGPIGEFPNFTAIEMLYKPDSLPEAIPTTLATNQSTFGVAFYDPYEAAVLKDKPVAYYRLGERPPPQGGLIPPAVDSSGNGNDGTYEDGASLGAGELIIDPALNTAVNFASGDVVIPDAPSLNFVNTKFTIEAWINGPLSVPLTNQRVFDKAQAGAPEGYVLDLGPSNVRLAGCTNLEIPFPLSDNITYHIVGVSDGAGTGYIYVNGVLAGSGPYSSCNPYTGSAHIAVANDGTAHFTGTIDEVAIYKSALSFQRILAHYNAGIGK
jgi:hypothetical protein